MAATTRSSDALANEPAAERSVPRTVVAAVARMLDESRFRRRFVNVGIQADILQSVPTVLFNQDSLGVQGAANYATVALSSDGQTGPGFRP